MFLHWRGVANRSNSFVIFLERFPFVRTDYLFHRPLFSLQSPSEARVIKSKNRKGFIDRQPKGGYRKERREK